MVNCIACGSNHTIGVMMIGGNYLHCFSCGFEFKKPKIKNNYINWSDNKNAS